MYFTILLHRIYLAVKSHIGFYSSIWERILFQSIRFLPFSVVGLQMELVLLSEKIVWTLIPPLLDHEIRLSDLLSVPSSYRAGDQSHFHWILCKVFVYCIGRVTGLGHSGGRMALWLTGIRIRWTFTDRPEQRGKGTFSERTIRRWLITCGCGTINNEINRHNLTNKCRKADKERTNSRKACRTGLRWPKISGDWARAGGDIGTRDGQFTNLNIGLHQQWYMGGDLHHGPIKCLPGNHFRIWNLNPEAVRIRWCRR